MSRTARQIAESYWEAEMRHDIEGVLSHYHPSAEFIPNGKRLVGHAEISTFYEDLGGKFPGLEVEIVREVGEGDTVALEWRAVLTDAAGNAKHLFGVNIVSIEDGLFRRVTAYFDVSALQ